MKFYEHRENNHQQNGMINTNLFYNVYDDFTPKVTLIPIGLKEASQDPDGYSFIGRAYPLEQIKPENYEDYYLVSDDYNLCIARSDIQGARNNLLLQYIILPKQTEKSEMPPIITINPAFDLKGNSDTIRPPHYLNPDGMNQISDSDDVGLVPNIEIDDESSIDGEMPVTGEIIECPFIIGSNNIERTGGNIVNPAKPAESNTLGESLTKKTNN